MTIRRASAAGLLVCAGIWGIALAPAAGAADLGEIIQTCEACHGKDGASTQPETPTIGGYSADYILDSMAIYKNDVRHCPPTNPAMCMIAKATTEEDAKKVAAYFAAKKFARAKQKFDRAKAERGKALHTANCARCHKIDANSRADEVGIVLAGQWMPYLEYTFREFITGNRPEPEAMKHKVEKLSKDELDALVHYYGSFQ